MYVAVLTKEVLRGEQKILEINVQSQLHDIMRHLQSSNSSPLSAAASEDKQEPRGEADDTQELSSWARRELFFSEEQATRFAQKFPWALGPKRGESAAAEFRGGRKSQRGCAGADIVFVHPGDTNSEAKIQSVESEALNSVGAVAAVPEPEHEEIHVQRIPPNSSFRRKAKADFEDIDVDHSGTLSRVEVREALGAYGLTPARIDQLFDDADINHDNELSVEEFTAGLMPLLLQAKETHSEKAAVHEAAQALILRSMEREKKQAQQKASTSRFALHSGDQHGTHRRGSVPQDQCSELDKLKQKLDHLQVCRSVCCESFILLFRSAFAPAYS